MSTATSSPEAVAAEVRRWLATAWDPDLALAAWRQRLRNILGEKILGLPHDVAVDRDLPFRQVSRNA